MLLFVGSFQVRRDNAVVPPIGPLPAAQPQDNQEQNNQVYIIQFYITSYNFVLYDRILCYIIEFYIILQNFYINFMQVLIFYEVKLLRVRILSPYVLFLWIIKFININQEQANQQVPNDQQQAPNNQEPAPAEQAVDNQQQELLNMMDDNDGNNNNVAHLNNLNNNVAPTDNINNAPADNLNNNNAPVVDNLNNNNNVPIDNLNNNNNVPAANNPAIDAERMPSILSLSMTFVISFFSSLFPERPEFVQFLELELELG